MGFVRTLLLGRENGFRARLRRRLRGAPPPAPPRAPTERPLPAERSLRLQPEAPKDVTPPVGFEVVLHKDALKPGQVTEVIVGGTAIAVANVGGTFHACANTCAHAEGPLGEGTLDGSIVTCPYHGWRYDVTTGACLTHTDVMLATWPVAIEGDAVCVRL